MVVVQSFVFPTEGIVLQQESTKAVMNTRELGVGTLYITESLMSWAEEKTGQGFSLQYNHIALHAISRDLTVYPKQCLYLMIDADIDDGCSERDTDSEGSEGGMTEIRFVPEDSGVLDAMFHAMTTCQALHPDPQESVSEEEYEAFEDADEEHWNEPTVPPVPLIRMLQVGQGHGIEAANGVDHDEPMETDEAQVDEQGQHNEQGQFDDAESEPKPGD